MGVEEEHVDQLQEVLLLLLLLDKVLLLIGEGFLHPLLLYLQFFFTKLKKVEELFDSGHLIN